MSFKMNVKYFVFVLFSTLLLSCGEQNFYEKNRTLANGKWIYGDTLNFDIEIEDTTTFFDFYITFRNTKAYNFSNVYFFLDSYYPDNDFSKDTIECPIAGPDGRWLGNVKSEYIDNKILFKRKVRFPKSGKYNFSFNHAMRKDTLEEIIDFGLTIKEHK
jgi:gliding motility-associated lipoprotein GldH